MRILLTGVAGFIGCNLAKTFLADGHEVLGIDNFSRGTERNLEDIKSNPAFIFIRSDIANYDALIGALKPLHHVKPIDEVWHMAANSDIPAGVSDAGIDLRDTFMTTFTILRVMEELNIPVIAFASSSAIYGDLKDARLTENIGPLFPISNYGAMKLASEAAITAAVESGLRQAFIFRFPNVIGVPATHGVVYDFVKKLRDRPDQLAVLGDGTQQKGYLHVEDLIDAMLFIRRQSKDKIGCYNIGAEDEGVTVRFIAEETASVVSPHAKISYGTGNRGWVGDVPRFQYSIEKLRSLGWSRRASSVDAMRRAIRQIAAQENL